jgi:hypothetical protein
LARAVEVELHGDLSFKRVTGNLGLTHG